MSTQKDGQQKEQKKDKKIEKTGELVKRGLQKQGIPPKEANTDSKKS